jgi:uncharacterized Zn finger protein (UPF0148 family)
MPEFKMTTFQCPDCRIPLYRFHTREGDDLIGCPNCGCGVWADAPHPQEALLKELLPLELRWPALIVDGLPRTEFLH